MRGTRPADRIDARPLAFALLLVLVVMVAAACGRTSDGAAGFRLTPAASALQVRQGESAGLSLTLEVASGFEEPVELAVDGLPEGVMAEFTEDPSRREGRMIVHAGANAPLGEHELTVHAAVGGVARSAAVTLTVTADAPSGPGAEEGSGTGDTETPDEQGEGPGTDGDAPMGDEQPDPDEATGPGDTATDGSEPIANDAPPPAPESVRFLNERETKLDVRWTSSSRAERYTVHRRIVPVVQPAYAMADLPSQQSFEYPMAPTPYGWKEIGSKSLDEQSHGSWPTYLYVTDDDLPSPDDRRLGAPYCYRVRAENEAGTVDSEEICTRLRGLNPPHSLDLVSRTERSLEFRWQDTSQLEDGYRLRIYHGADRSKTLPANRESGSFSGLHPDTEYCVSVRAYDFWGRSQSDSVCERTRPAPEPEPEEKSFTLNLQRQDVSSGPIPYYGRLPTAGSGNGSVTRVESPGWAPTLYFVKPGHDTSECNDPDAVVVLESGSALSADEMDEAFGSEMPSLPVHFVACAAPTGTVYDWIPINVSYTGNL